MSIIAYRDEIVATDSQLSQGPDPLAHDFPKMKSIPKSDGTHFAIAAGTGNPFRVERFFRWMAEGLPWRASHEETHTAVFGSSDDDCSSTLIYFRSDRTAHFCNDESFPVFLELDLQEQDYLAFGSGQEYALGAMHAGATAVEAVMAAIAHDGYCGGGVHFAHLRTGQVELVTL